MKKSPIRSIHTLPAIDIEASGPSYSVSRLCEALVDSGIETRLAVLDWVPGMETPGYVHRFPLGAGPRRLGRSPSMKKWMSEQLRSNSVDIIHNHSLWMMPNVYPGLIRKHADFQLIVSPRGTLSNWALNNNAWTKKIFWRICQSSTMQRAKLFHATSESEYEDIRRAGFNQPVAILPNGIDMPGKCQDEHASCRTLLFLSRIHKIKGLDMLLPAWKAVEDRFPEWRLVVVGSDSEGYLDELQRVAYQLGTKRVQFSGPLYGQQKWAAYQSAELFVLPTYSENFGLVVAEALAVGTPAVVTKGAPWSGLKKYGAGWWVDVGVEPLAKALDEAMSSSKEKLADKGRKGAEWMAEDYSWQAIGTQWVAVYQWLLSIGDQPNCVRMN